MPCDSLSALTDTKSLMSDHPPHPAHEPCPPKATPAVRPGDRFGPLSKTLLATHKMWSELSARLRQDHERIVSEAKAVEKRAAALSEDFARAALEELGAVPDDVSGVLLVPEVVDGQLFVSVKDPAEFKNPASTGPAKE